MDIPILTDTEAETSLEHAEEWVNQRTTNKATTHNATSIFNITLEDVEEEQKHASVDFKDYETRLLGEMKDWKSLLNVAYQDYKQSKQKHPTIDKTILPPEKLQYLEKAPCLQNFIRESTEFRKQAHLFLELDYAEFMEMIENLEVLYEHRLQLIKITKIKENLADVKKN